MSEYDNAREYAAEIVERREREIASAAEQTARTISRGGIIRDADWGAGVRVLSKLTALLVAERAILEAIDRVEAEDNRKSDAADLARVKWLDDLRADRVPAKRLATEVGNTVDKLVRAISPNTYTFVDGEYLSGAALVVHAGRAWRKRRIDETDLAVLHAAIKTKQTMESNALFDVLRARSFLEGYTAAEQKDAST